LQVIFDALVDGGRPPIPSADARTAVEIILAIYRSAAEGRPVQLHSVSRATGEPAVAP
jgi:predicted dehydrogenase